MIKQFSNIYRPEYERKYLYLKINKINFNTITKERLEYIKNLSLFYNSSYSNIKDIKLKRKRYVEIIHYFRLRHIEELKINTSSELALLFLLSIDPNLELLTLYLSIDDIEELKKESLDKLGFYDYNLIKIEREYIKHFYSEEEKNKIYSYQKNN